MPDGPARVESLGGVIHPHAIEIQDFSSYALILDVRPINAFEDDHLPGAVRVEPMGEADRSVGASFAGPRTSILVARDVMNNQPPADVLRLASAVRYDQAILIYCGRGGLDSEPLAQVLRWRGWTVDVLPGGWINYRRWVLAGLETAPSMAQFNLISSALSWQADAVLQALGNAGLQVLDIARLAGCRTATNVDQRRPSQSAFESRLLQCLREFDPRLPIWLSSQQDEIAPLRLPGALHDALALSPVAQVMVTGQMGLGDSEPPHAESEARRRLQPLAVRSFGPADLDCAIADWMPAAMPGDT